MDPLLCPTWSNTSVCVTDEKQMRDSVPTSVHLFGIEFGFNSRFNSRFNRVNRPNRNPRTRALVGTDAETECRVRPPVPRAARPIDLRQTARESRKMVHHQSPARCQRLAESHTGASNFEPRRNNFETSGGLPESRASRESSSTERVEQKGWNGPLGMDKNLTAQPYNHRKRRRRIDRAGGKVTG